MRSALPESGKQSGTELGTDGAVLRMCPKAITVAVIFAGLLPIMWSSGTGAEVIQRIAAPMIGGMITASLLSMLVIPAAWLLMQRRKDQARIRCLCAIRQPRDKCRPHRAPRQPVHAGCRIRS